MVERRKIRVKMSLTNLMEFKKEDDGVIFYAGKSGSVEIRVAVLE